MDADELKRVLDDMDFHIERIKVQLTWTEEAIVQIRKRFSLIRVHLAGMEEPALTSAEVNCD